MSDTQWDVWEVFVQANTGKPFEHVGSIHGSDKELALQNARDLYGRRGSVANIWLVPSDAIVASTPEDVSSFFDPSNEKIYRHPNFYKIPRGVNVDIH
jgi:ring-1,2-phenylacetyl-CoA epoxidase subunit PaaB